MTYLHLAEVGTEFELDGESWRLVRRYRRHKKLSALEIKNLVTGRHHLGLFDDSTRIRVANTHHTIANSDRIEGEK